MSASQDCLQCVSDDVIACRLCPRLVAWREQVGMEKRKAFRDQEYWSKPIPGFGDTNARVLVLGLAPGAHGSNRTGRMFTGDDSGRFLYAALHRAGFANQPGSLAQNDGLVVNKLWITAVCRCVPPDNKPNSSEIANCHPFLTREMNCLPRLEGIVVLGKIAFDAVIGMYDKWIEKPKFGHAAYFPMFNSRPWILASYHPSRQNTQTGRLTALMFDEIWIAVKKLLKLN
jgi:uracil-DNA glycosylase